MKEFILAENEDTYDTLHAFGEISSELKGSKLIATEENDFIQIKTQEGSFEYTQNEDCNCDKDFVVEEETNLYEFSKTDFNIKEVERLLEYLRG